MSFPFGQVYMDVGIVAHATGSAYAEFNHTKVKPAIIRASNAWPKQFNVGVPLS